MSTTLAAAASTSTLDKLIRRLGSSHDGERLATVHAIERVLKTAGRDWHDLADAIAPRKIELATSISDWRGLVRFCSNHARLLNDRERDFVSTLARYHSEPSPKQMAWLRVIATRLRGAAA